MGITAKEIAKKLNLSQTAVSMALHNKPGVSRETRQAVLDAADKYGYDFSKLSFSRQAGNIYFIDYRMNYIMMANNALFAELIDGAKQVCEKNNYPLFTYPIYNDVTDFQIHLNNLRGNDCIGIILLGTDTPEAVLKTFLQLSVPLVLIDAYLPSLPCNSITISNEQGAYDATKYLINRSGKKPGYIRSHHRLPNLTERENGFKAALRDNALSDSQYIVHEVSADIEGAFTDMLKIIESNDTLAECYFAENDHLAIGVLKALKLKGYRIPEDISIIGFDDIPESRVVEPALTTIHVPRHYIGKTAAEILIKDIQTPGQYVLRTSVNPKLIKRLSV